MKDPPAAAARKPCCVCDGPGGQHCAKCKSRHYCGKACQLVDWYERGHKAQCKQLAAEFQDRILDALEAGKNDTLNLRGTCAICLDLLPVEVNDQTFYECCCNLICSDCFVKCEEYDERCPLCRTQRHESDAEYLIRLQKYVDEGNAEAQLQLGNTYRQGAMGRKISFKRAVKLYESAAAQGHALAQHKVGSCYACGEGVKINHKTAAQWFRRAAEQGLPAAQVSLGVVLYAGRGVAQSYNEAARWNRLAAAKGHATALYILGLCSEDGRGVPRDLHEVLRFYKRALAQGYAKAAADVEKLEARLAADSDSESDSAGSN